MNKTLVAKRLISMAKELLGGVAPGVPDGTGPYGRGMGPGRGTGFCPFDEEEKEPVVGSKKTAQHLENVKTLEALTERELTRAIRDAIIAEEDAIKQYETVADSTDDEQAKEVLQDIANEEKVHVGELQKLLADRLDDEQGFLDEGADEVS